MLKRRDKAEREHSAQDGVSHFEHNASGIRDLRAGPGWSEFGQAEYQGRHRNAGRISGAQVRGRTDRLWPHVFTLCLP